MNLVPTDVRDCVTSVHDRHPEWTTAMILGRCMVDPKHRETVERLVQE